MQMYNLLTFFLFNIYYIPMSKNANNSNLATNKKAYHEYEILTEYEAGIELHGTEVKSIRAGKMNLKESIVKRTAIHLIKLGKMTLEEIAEATELSLDMDKELENQSMQLT